MTYLQAIILGVIQGATEFLPISSSAHLALTPWLFGFADPGLTFDVALHFGTFFAILLYFWKDWLDIFKGALDYVRSSAHRDPQNTFHFNLLVILVLATLPAVIAGLLLEDYAETVFRSPLIMAFNLTFWGLLLWWVDAKLKKSKKIKHLTLKEGFFIGLAQCLALVPGVSRSGITMTAGLFRGLNRESAARFSFLLATPITFGACVMKSKDFIRGNPGGPHIVGILVSALVGFLCIKYLLQFLRTYSFKVFAIYRIALACVIVILYFV